MTASIKKLKAVATINPRRPSIERDNNLPTSFVPMEDVDEVIGAVATLSSEPYSKVKNGYTYFEDGDVIFAKITPCMQNGKHAVLSGLIDGFGFGSTEFHVIRPSEEITSEWIHCFLRRRDTLNAAINTFTGAVGQQRVPESFLEELEIPVPDTDAQRRIAASINSQLAEVEKSRQAAFLQLRDVKLLRTRILREIFNRLNSVEIKVLGDWATTTSGSTPSRGIKQYWQPPEIPWVKTGEVNFSTIIATEESISKVALAECSLSLLAPQTVLIAMYGQGKTRGQSAILEIEATTNQACFAILPNDTWEPEFLYYWSMASYQDLRNLSENRGGNQANLNGALLNALEIPAPNKAEQRQTVQKVKAALSQVDILEETSKQMLADIEQLPNRILVQGIRVLIMAKTKNRTKQPKSIGSTQSLSSFVKSICNVMRRSNCASALQYVPELTWILFLRILDAQESRRKEEAEAVGEEFTPALKSPYRWQDWAAPHSDKPEHPKTVEGKPYGWKRAELFAAGDGKLFEFINTELLPSLHVLDIDSRTGLPNPIASPKQRIIGRIMTAVEKVRVDSEANLRDILDKVHEIHIDHVNDTHFFTLSQVYEDLLLKMGEKNSDGGQFFTPREVIRAMVHTVDPSLGKKIYDPCCGTGGFLAIAYEHIARKMGRSATSTDINTLKHDTFFGKEKENLVFPIALANLVLHGIDQPNLWHGNTLTGRATYDALFKDAPPTFDVILTNPPFGGKEGKDAQKNYAFETGSTQVLFVQDILSELAPTGTCAIVLDEGLLFRTNESAFVDTKRKLTEECNLWCILSLPGGVFSTAGAGVKTNLLFFTKGNKTDKIWYYDLSYVKVGKKTPLTLAHFGFGTDGEVLADNALPATLKAEWLANDSNACQHFPSYARMLANRGTSEGESRYSWSINFADKRKRAKAEMQPLQEEAAEVRAAIIDLKEQLRDLRRANGKALQIETIENEIAEKQRITRELEAKASEIDAATFDLKAVNPRAVVKTDSRTSEQIIQSIEDQGKIVRDALTRLRALLEHGSA